MGTTVVIGLDIAKTVFQAHGVDAGGQITFRKRIRRSELLQFFVKQSPSLVGIEACGAAHHWGRELANLGHEVRLMPPNYVKPYVKRGKSDVADAEAIAEAVTRPTMRYVPLKTVEQQAVLVLHQSRELLVKQRTMVANVLRGHLAEFGMVAPKGLTKVADLMDYVRSPNSSLQACARTALLVIVGQIEALTTGIREIEREIALRHEDDELAQLITTIPGVGSLTASAVTATISDPTRFRSGREFAAWIGLVPRQNSTGGKATLGRISKAGNHYLRRLLVIGATAVLRHAKRKPTEDQRWALQLLERKPPKLAAVALANKMARVIWAMLSRGEEFRRGYGSGIAAASA